MLDPHAGQSPVVLVGLLPASGLQAESWYLSAPLIPAPRGPCQGQEAQGTGGLCECPGPEHEEPTGACRARQVLPGGKDKEGSGKGPSCAGSLSWMVTKAQMTSGRWGCLSTQGLPATVRAPALCAHHPVLTGPLVYLGGHGSPSSTPGGPPWALRHRSGVAVTRAAAGPNVGP